MKQPRPLGIRLHPSMTTPAVVEPLMRLLKEGPQRPRVVQGYAVMGNEDMIEGRGAAVALHYAVDLEEAERLAVRAGPCGGDAYLKKMWLLCFYEEGGTPRFLAPLDAFHDKRPGPTLREKALAKLTPDERAALGL